jgi:hypothetical protein
MSSDRDQDRSIIVRGVVQHDRKSHDKYYKSLIISIGVKLGTYAQLNLRTLLYGSPTLCGAVAWLVRGE